MSFLMTLFTRRVPASSCGDDDALPGSRYEGRQEPAGGFPDLPRLPHLRASRPRHRARGGGGFGAVARVASAGAYPPAAPSAHVQRSEGHAALGARRTEARRQAGAALDAREPRPDPGGTRKARRRASPRSPNSKAPTRTQRPIRSTASPARWESRLISARQLPSP